MKSWFAGTASSVNSEIITPFSNAEQIIYKYNQAIEHNSLTQQGWQRLIAQCDDGLASYLTNIKGSTASMSAYSVSLQGNITGYTKITQAMKQYNALGAVSQKEQQNFATAVSLTNTKLGSYLTGLNGAKASLSGYGVSLIASTAKTVGLTIATTALNAALTFGISAIITGVVSAFATWINSSKKITEAAEEAKDKISSINDDLKTNTETVENAKQRYAELAQEVENLGKVNQSRGSLSIDEYEEFLDLSNQLADVFPQLTKGYDDNGNAILDLSGNVNTIVGSLDDLLQKEKDLANQKIMDEFPDVYKGYVKDLSKAESEVKSAKSEFDKINNAYQQLQNSGGAAQAFDLQGNGTFENADGEQVKVTLAEYEQALKDLGIEYEKTNIMVKNQFGGDTLSGYLINATGDIDTAFTNKLETARKNLQYAEQQLEGEKSSIDSYLNTWLQSEFTYNQIDDSGLQTAVQDMIMNFDFSNLPENVDKDNWNEVSEYLRRNILFAINDVQDDPDISKAISEVFTNQDLTPDEKANYLQQIKDYFDNLLGKDNAISISLQPQIEDTGALQKSYEDTINRFKSSEEANLEELKQSYQEAIDKRKELYSGENYVGNVDINNRPVVINDDGSYSTTSTSFQEKWVGDEENGHYIIAHFTPILPDGTVLDEDSLNEYIDKILNSDDPMEADKVENGGKGIVYKVDTQINGKDITDDNLEDAFGVADAWDVDMHNLQDKMYKDEAAIKAQIAKFDDGVDGSQKIKDFFDTEGINTDEEINEFNEVTKGINDADKAIQTWNEHKKEANETPISFLDSLNSSEYADIKEKLLDLAKSGEITPKTLSSTKEYNELLSKTNTSAEDATNQILDMLSAQERLSSATQGLDKLKSAYEEFQNKDIGFVTAGTLESLPDAFKNLPEFDLFSKIVGNPESGKEKIQQAFNDIVNSYLSDRKTLQGLVNADNATIQSYIANLKQMGIKNAEEVVKQYIKEYNSNSKLLKQAEKNYIKYLNSKGTNTEISNKKLNQMNANLINALGSQYKTDYNNWLKLIQDKEKAYNAFVEAYNKASTEGQTVYKNNQVKGVLSNEAYKNLTNNPQASVEAFVIAQNKKKYNKATKEYNKIKKDLHAKLDTVHTNYTTDYTPTTTSSGKDSKNKSKNTKTKAKATAQIIDFVERRINKLTKAAEDAKNAIDNMFSRSSKNKQIDKTIAKTNALIKAEQKAAKLYQLYANKSAKVAQKTTKETISSSGIGDNVVSEAKKYIGKLKYSWGGASLISGADCSGFVQQIFKQFGVNLARTSQSQYNTTKGTKITNKKALKKGDLVFFGNNGDASKIHHVGIYAGNGKFIDSPHRGAKVSTHSLSNRSDFVGGVRVSKGSSNKKVKVKGLSQSTVDKYIKLIKNGSLNTKAIKSIKNEKLKTFVQDYQNWYDKSKDALEKVKELQKQQAEYQKQKYQNYVDEANDYISKNDTQIELATTASHKNAIEKNKIKYIKQSYKYQEKIAKQEKDSLKLATLRVQKEKDLLAVRKEILQNSLDENESKRALLDAKLSNATSTTAKNKILSDEMKTYDSDYKANQTYYNSSVSNRKSKGKTATTNTNKATTLSDNDRKKINNYIKQGKKIPKTLLNKVKKTNNSWYNSLVNYNNKYADNSSFSKALKNSKKIDKKTKNIIKKDLKDGKTISKSTLNKLKKKDSSLYKKATEWNKEKTKRNSVSKKISNTKSLTKADKNKIKSLIKAGKAIPSNLMKKVKAANPSLYSDLVNYNNSVEDVKDALNQRNLSKEQTKADKRAKIKEQFDNIQSDYDRKSTFLTQKNNAIANELSIAEARGQVIGQAYYTRQMANLEIDKKDKEKEFTELSKKLKNIDFGTDEWYEAQEALNSVGEAIQQDTQSIAEFQKSINDLKFDRFDELLNKFGDITDETDFLIDMLDSDNLFDSDTGMITQDGITAIGLTAQNYDTYLAEAQKYKDAIADLDEMYKNGNGTIGYNDYISKLREYQQGMRNSIKSANDAKKATVDYIKQGLDAQNDALEEAISKKKELLETEKDLKEWNDKLADSNKNIAKLEKQIAALEGDDSEENRKKLQQFKSDLQDAQKDQSDMLYDHSVSDQEKALDDMLTKSKESAESYLKDTEKVLSDAFTYVNANSSQIASNIEKIAKDTGYDISSYIVNAWEKGGNAVGDYASTLSSNVPNITAQLSLIESSWKAICNAADKAAEASAKYAEIKVNKTQSGDSDNTNNSSNGSSNSNNLTHKDNSVPSDFIKEFIIGALRPANGKTHYGALNSHLFTMTQKVLSVRDEVELGKLLDVDVKNDLSGNRDRERILDALLKRRIQFAQGGILGDLVKVSGEDGLFIGSRGESVLTKEQTQALINFKPVIPQLNTMFDTFKNIPVNSGMQSPTYQIDNRTIVEGVATDQIVKQMEGVAQKQAENVVKKINQATYAKGVRR